MARSLIRLGGPDPAPGVVDLAREERGVVAAEWAELCRWDPMLPPDSTPPSTGDLVLRAVLHAAERPQPIAWGVDIEVEEAAVRFASEVGTVDEAVEQLICLREALSRRLRDDLSGETLVELLGRTSMIVDRAIGVVVQQTTRQLETEALTDPLTTLANRRALQRDLRRELARCARHRSPFAVVVLDVDGLKRVNDERGHHAGDDLLFRLAADLRASLRAGDGAYRLGGDEFALVLPETGGDEAELLLRRLVPSLHTSISWGLAVCPSDGATATELYETADQRLYRQRARKRAWSDARASPGTM